MSNRISSIISSKFEKEKTSRFIDVLSATYGKCGGTIHSYDRNLEYISPGIHSLLTGRDALEAHIILKRALSYQV